MYKRPALFRGTGALLVCCLVVMSLVSTTTFAQGERETSVTVDGNRVDSSSRATGTTAASSSSSSSSTSDGVSGTARAENEDGITETTLTFPSENPDSDEEEDISSTSDAASEDGVVENESDLEVPDDVPEDGEEEGDVDDNGVRSSSSSTLLLMTSVGASVLLLASLL